MIVPRMPLAWLALLGMGELVGVSVGESDDDEADGARGGAGLVAGGAGVWLDFEGAPEGAWLAGLDDFPDFLAPGEVDPVPEADAPAPCVPGVFLGPDRDAAGWGVLTAGAARADGTAGADSELAGVGG